MKDLKEFTSDLKKKNLAGYWETSEGEVYREPASTFEPCLWKWKDVHDAIIQAGEVVGLERVSRRVIRLCSPAKGTTAHTFQFNIQMLQPGEHAVAHRHTQAGVRFVIRGKGARCVVEGESFDMEEGDFLTNPGWTWHEHVSHSAEPVLWIDALDSPLMRFLEVGFHEPHPDTKQTISKAEGTTLAECGPTRPNWIQVASNQPPGYRYRWTDTERVLKALGEKPGNAHDGILLEYVNPLNGGPTLPTMSCGIQMLRPGEKTQSHRHTSSAIYHAFRGTGATVIDQVRYEWEAGDCFSVPLWRFHHHENLSGEPAILFVLNNQPALNALGYYREEKAKG
jgi:1-hydroxy-2-naphthoate dioxygenase